MVRGIDSTKQKKKHSALMEEKDYITETWLQGGKAIGDILKPKKKQRKKK
jgi:hypothetical protein